MNPMTTHPQQTTRSRWVLVFLAALVTVATIIGLAGTASATSNPTAENRVRASNAVVTPLVGPPQSVSAGQHPDDTQIRPGIVVATGVATKAAPEVASGLERTGTALSKSDAFHRSVSWVVDNPAAQRFAIKGGDGVSRDLYQLPGEVNGKSGVFEWIIDRSGTNPVINHQRFIPGGSVSGYPNQVVR